MMAFITLYQWQTKQPRFNYQPGKIDSRREAESEMFKNEIYLPPSSYSHQITLNVED